MNRYNSSNAINPDDYISPPRQGALIDMAQVGMPASAVRIAIREAVFAALTTTILELEVCDGTCVNADPEDQCESCADLEMRMNLGMIPDTRVLVPKGT